MILGIQLEMVLWITLVISDILLVVDIYFLTEENIVAVKMC